MAAIWKAYTVLVVVAFVATLAYLYTLYRNKEEENMTNEEAEKVKRTIKVIVWNNGNLAQFRQETGIRNIDGVKYATLIGLQKRGELTTEAIKKVGI